MGDCSSVRLGKLTIIVRTLESSLNSTRTDIALALQKFAILTRAMEHAVFSRLMYPMAPFILIATCSKKTYSVSSMSPVVALSISINMCSIIAFKLECSSGPRLISGRMASSVNSFMHN